MIYVAFKRGLGIMRRGRPQAFLLTVQGLEYRPFAGEPGFCVLAPN